MTTADCATPVTVSLVNDYRLLRFDALLGHRPATLGNCKVEITSSLLTYEIHAVNTIIGSVNNSSHTISLTLFTYQIWPYGRIMVRNRFDSGTCWSRCCFTADCSGTRDECTQPHSIAVLIDVNSKLSFPFSFQNSWSEFFQKIVVLLGTQSQL